MATSVVEVASGPKTCSSVRAHGGITYSVRTIRFDRQPFIVIPLNTQSWLAVSGG
jgi:hypothetical protein